MCETFQDLEPRQWQLVREVCIFNMFLEQSSMFSFRDLWFIGSMLENVQKFPENNKILVREFCIFNVF